MYKSEIEIIYNDIQNLVFSKKLADAINKLGYFLKESHSYEQMLDFENLASNYKMMLEYFINGNVDAERQKVYVKISGTLLEINDKARQNAFFYCPELPQYKSKNYYTNQGKLTSDTAIAAFEKIISAREIAFLLKNTEIRNEENNLEDQSLQGIEELFRLFWLTDKYDDAEIDLYHKIMDAESVYWYEKCLMVSAVTLGLLNTLDTHKISLLINTFHQHIPQVSERALIGLFLCLYKYDKRIKYYPIIEAELKLLSDNPSLIDEARIIISQLIVAKDTEKLTKKLQEEILPDVIKHAPDIVKRFDIEDFTQDSDDDEKDPKWKSFLKETPDLYQKFEELSKLQIQGGDMFMSAFAHLKHFPFFNKMTNWLIPFYSTNYSLAGIISTNSSSINNFYEAMESAPYICNSDKYSFCFNLKALAEQQRNMLIEMFIAEMNSMAEVMYEDGKINSNISKRYIYVQYIQDLYRFFKLNPYKTHFIDIFDWTLDIYNTSFFKILFDDNKLLHEIADFYFEKEHYQHALNIFIHLYKQGITSLELLQKIGFCYQKLQKFHQAIEFYKHADLMESSNIWTLKKLAYCFRKINDLENALKYYLELEKLDPDNLTYQIKLGQTWFKMGNAEEALKHYFKVEFLNPNNPKILKPIAWICLTQARVDDAKKAYEKIPEHELNYNDRINLGHISWLKNDRTCAVEHYHKSILEHPNGLKGFMEIFNQDVSLLLKLGINSDEIPLLLDYLENYGSRI